MPTRFHALKSKTTAYVVSHGKKLIWLTVGLVALLLGVIGIFLPLLPTTPFIIVAAFAFGKSIPAWRRWMIGNKTLGPIIKNWEETGAIAPRYKAIAVTMMLAALALSLYLSIKPVIIVIQAICMTAACWFILTRPNGTP